VRKKREIPKYNDFPFDETMKAARKLAMEGNVIIQKWTCAGCGARLCGVPNHWTDHGRCDEVEGKPGCKTVTDIRKTGCNYALVQSTDPTFIRRLLNQFDPDLH
jgi:hypothetical protein